MNAANSIPQLVLIFTKSILHVRLMKDLLTGLYDTLDVNQQSSCIEMLRSIQVDYLIIDERVIEENTISFLTQIKTIKEDKPFSILLFTSNLKKSHEQEMKKVGVDQLLREPIDKKLLLNAIKQANPKDRIKNKISSLAKSIGVPNQTKELEIKHRLLLNPHAQLLVKKILKEKGNLFLLLVELDQFFAIAGQYGETTLKSITSLFEKIVERHVRPQDGFFSLGGGKAVVICPKTSKSVALLIAEEIQKEIQLEKFPVDSTWLHLTSSIGIVEQKYVEDETKSFEEFTHTLNLAIGVAIQAKEKGNQIKLENSL